MPAGASHRAGGLSLAGGVALRGRAGGEGAAEGVVEFGVAGLEERGGIDEALALQTEAH